MIMSASCSASALTVAPAAVNSEPGSPDLTPPRGSTATSTRSALNFFTVSGEAATRGSDGSISLATAIFIRPPAHGTRVRELARIPIRKYRLCDRNAGNRWKDASPGGNAARDGSGQENRHHGNDEDDSGGAVFHQPNKTFIGRLMRGIVVTVRSGVGNFVVVRHRFLRRSSRIELQLAQSGGESNGGGPSGARLCHLFSRVRGPVVPDPAGQALFPSPPCRESKNHGTSAFGWHQEIDVVEA